MSGEDYPLSSPVTRFAVGYAIGAASGLGLLALAAAWTVGKNLFG